MFILSKNYYGFNLCDFFQTLEMAKSILSSEHTISIVTQTRQENAYLAVNYNEKCSTKTRILFVIENNR